MKKTIAVITGAGISAESGLATFRGADGLWEEHRIEEVATPEAWAENPALVNQFYNARRRQLLDVEPNAAHRALASLETEYDVHIITQNVDNLHERGGATQVYHLHGKLDEVRSSVDTSYVLSWTGDLTLEDLDPHGHPLRPNIVWFGEAVPMIAVVEPIVARADLILVIGTSLQVYPAASLIYAGGSDVPVMYIDPHPATDIHAGTIVLRSTAVAAVDEMKTRIKEWLP